MSSRPTVLRRWSAVLTLLAALGIGGWVRAELPLEARPTLDAPLGDSLVGPAVDLSDAFVNIAASTTPGVMNVESRLSAGI